MVYDWIYNKGYRDGKEEGELSARKDICEARLELASLRLARLRGEAPTPDPLNADELAAYLQALRENRRPCRPDWCARRCWIESRCRFPYGILAGSAARTTKRKLNESGCAPRQACQRAG